MRSHELSNMIDVRRDPRTIRIAILAATFLAGVLPAQADVFRDLAYGLGYIGFDIQGNHNVLSGGADLLATNTFLGNELDFGAADLTLQGPLSFSLSSGGRHLSELELAFRTAPDSGTAASPLNYLFNVDVGGQSAQIRGNIFLDGNLTFNGFGFYDLRLHYSSRQTVTREGQIANDTTDFDFDYGPIDISGNVFTDVLALITEPLFAAAGQPNFFSELGAKAAAGNQLLSGSREAAGDLLAAGIGTTDEQLASLASRAVLDQLLGGTLRGLSPSNMSLAVASPAGGRVVPEPSVLVLMLLGLPLLVRRSRRRTRSKPI